MARGRGSVIDQVHERRGRVVSYFAGYARGDRVTFSIGVVDLDLPDPLETWRRDVVHLFAAALRTGARDFRIQASSDRAWFVDWMEREVGMERLADRNVWVAGRAVIASHVGAPAGSLSRPQPRLAAAAREPALDSSRRRQPIAAPARSLLLLAQPAAARRHQDRRSRATGRELSVIASAPLWPASRLRLGVPDAPGRREDERVDDAREGEDDGRPAEVADERDAGGQQDDEQEQEEDASLPGAAPRVASCHDEPPKAIWRAGLGSPPVVCWTVAPGEVPWSLPVGSGAATDYQRPSPAASSAAMTKLSSRAPAPARQCSVRGPASRAGGER
jgi:hypothetical protein